MLRMLNERVRRNPLITRLLFGVEVHGNQRIHWDFTTLALKGCLARRVRSGHRVLEVGTGPHAILSIFLVKHQMCEVVACDIRQAYVREAKRTARANSVSLDVVCSDLFSSIRGKFDVIFFNSVYIPWQVGKRLGIDRLHDSKTDWCGGEDGVETIERFLSDARTSLNKGGELLLGFSARYLRQDTVVGLCDRYGYTVRVVFTKFPNPSRVLVIGQEE